MNRYSNYKNHNNNTKTFIVSIKNKWTNSTKTVKVSKFADQREAHKFAYYKYTNNLEEIMEMTDRSGRKVFSYKHGFKG